jgi:hypothetical protein
MPRLLSAENISSVDRPYLVSHLEMTQEFVRDATRGLTNEQWLFKPAPLRWSITQCIDHLALIEEYVLHTGGPRRRAAHSSTRRRTTGNPDLFAVCVNGGGHPKPVCSLCALERTETD